jgi:PKD repeat protein
MPPTQPLAKGGSRSWIVLIVLLLLTLVLSLGSVLALQITTGNAVAAAYPQPTVRINGLPTGIVRPGSTVDLTALSTGRNLTYSWDFGDGSTSSNQHVTHTYSVSGQFTVSVTVKDPLGKTAIDKSGAISVLAPPTAYFTCNIYTYFDYEADCNANLSSADNTLTIASYIWDWGDSSAKETQTLDYDNHYYTTKSTYTISLTVVDSAGQTSQPYTLQVTV